jgi:hypothetical protein
MSLSTLKTGAAVVVAVAGLFAGGTARAQSFAHIDRLAVQLERDARAMHREVDLHFRRTPQYRHLHDDVSEMERLARHIHEVVHRGASVRHLRSDVEELDRLFHHVEDLVEDLARFRGIDPYAFSHFRWSLRRMERTLHHLRDDLRELDHHHGHHHP